MVKRNDAILLYMPLWTNVTTTTTTLNQTAVEERYTRFGGVPRYVFKKKVQSLEEILSQAILNSSTALDKLRRGVFSQASNMLAHLIPNDDFLSYTLDFASEYVEERVDIALTGDIQQAAIEYLNKVLKANLYKTLGPFNGTHYLKRLFIKCLWMRNVSVSQE